MRYGSLCSGIEAATCAWHPLGWRPQFFSEIDKAASRFLAHTYPDTPNLGDMTKFQEWPDHAIDLLAGGTPCQSFSVAGLRKGLADPRGNLMLTYLAIADRYRPKWLVWENVPGVLSSDGGRDFAAFLGGLGQLGYGWAYRVLDAQYVRVESHPWAVPQRRRRVFVVGCARGWQRAAAVLFERESLCGHPPPRRETGKGTARDVAPSLVSSGRGVERSGDTRGQDPVVAELIASTGDLSHCLNAGGMGRIDFETETMIAHALRGEGYDASEDGSGRATPIVPVAFDCKGTQVQTDDSGSAPTLRSMNNDASHQNGGGQLAVAYRTAGDGAAYEEGDVTAPLTTATDPNAQVLTLAIRGRGDSHQLEYRSDGTANAILTPNGGRAGIGVGAIATQWAVRRLTPLECERLQGFPDGYTAETLGGKTQADGVRYKQLGNSMAVNCMRWIGERIDAVAKIEVQP